MKAWFSHLGFGQKIQLLINMVSISVLVLALCIIALSFYTKFKENMEERVLQKSSLLADAVAVGVVFEQDESVFMLLDSLSVDKGVDSAVVYKKYPDRYDAFSFYARQKEEFSAPDYQSGAQVEWLDQQLVLRIPIMVDGEEVGQLHVREDNLYLEDLLLRSFAYLLPVMLCSAMLIWIVSRVVQRRLARPLRDLTQSVREVSKSRDYTARVVIDSKDELGELGDAFNQMMEELADFDAMRVEKENEIISLNAHLEEKVFERTKELTASLDDLRLTQQQLVEQEKMASLGELVAGVAHEINTPIGVGITAVSYLDESLKRMQEGFESGSLTKADFTNILGSLNESAKIISGNLARAAELVRAFKSVAVDQSSEEARLFDLSDYVHDVLMSLRPKLKRYAHEITVDIPKGIQIYSDPGIFSQIITNFVMNSLNHAFSPEEKGLIQIGAKVESGTLNLHYSDNGHGIEPDILRRLFEPFVTTKRGQGGSGLGTHIIYNLVTQVLNGKINCDSEIGKGVRFDINAPMDKLSP